MQSWLGEEQTCMNKSLKRVDNLKYIKHEKKKRKELSGVSFLAE